jgi:signal transduction histidine kinase
MRPLAALALLSLVAIAVVAGIAAASTVGHPFPGLFVDPYADYSTVAVPGWEPEVVELIYPDRLIAIDGRPLSREGAYPALAAAAEYRRLAEAHRERVTLTFRAASGDKQVERKLVPLGATEVGLFFGFYSVAALLSLWTGGMVLVLAGGRAGARAYALWSVGAYLLFISFYDYHTTCRLPVAFSLGGVGFDLGMLWMAYAFPAAPRRFDRPLRWAVRAVTAVGVAGAAWLLLAPLVHGDAQWTRYVVSLGVPIGLVVLAVSILLRLAQAKGAERAPLLAATWGLVVTCGVLAVGFGLVMFGSAKMSLFVSLAVPFLPLSIGVSLIRHNVLDTYALLSRRLLVGPVVLASAGAGLLAWLGLHSALQPQLSAWLAPALALPGAAGAFVALNRLSTRMLFQAVAQFRPTIEQLSDQLSSVHELPDIRRAIEGTVSRWLPVSAPVRVLEGDELDALPGAAPADAGGRLAEGEHVWLPQGARGSLLLIPMRSVGTLRGAILLPPKRGDALYTTEDFTLLATIASLGAVAIHHAKTLIELEAYRRGVVEATRDEKKYALGLVGAELSHEIAYPLNFFRYLLKRCARGDALETQDLEIGSEEVARLERMLAAMKLLESATPKLAPVPVWVPLRRAVELIREHVEEKALVVKLDVPESLTVRANADMMLQIFANLLRNSAQAVDRGGTIGVRAALADGDLRMECWDDGPGVPESLRERIWTPWVTTRPGGSGLGLAITQRLVQKLGWRIALETRGSRTAFCVYVPRAALLEPPERTAA